MPSTPLIRRDADSVHISLNVDGCEYCATALAAATPEQGRSVKGSGTYLASAVTDCPDEDMTVRVASADGRYSVQFRTVEEDIYSGQPLRRTAIEVAYESHVRDLAAASLLAMAADLPKWGITPDMDDEATAARLTHALVWCGTLIEDQMDSWLALGVTNPRDAVVWDCIGMTLDDAATWIHAGVTHASDARDFRDAGLTPDQIPTGLTDPISWAFTQIAGVPATDQWSIMWSLTSPGFARIGHQQGQDGVAVTRLGAALNPHFNGALAAILGDRDGTRNQYEVRGLTVTSPWTKDVEAANEQFAADLDGLDWADAAACIRAGMSPQDTLNHLREGRDMGPVKVLAGLTR